MTDRLEQSDGVDNSLEALRARLVVIQEPLGDLIVKSCDLFDTVYPLAPHASIVDKDYPVYRVGSANLCPFEGIPMGRELTVVLGGGRWLRVFRNSSGSPDSYPRKRLWNNKPEGENTRRTNIFYTHDPRRVDIPYDIELVDYTTQGICAGLVGDMYHKMEQPIAEADKALDDAINVANRLGLRPR